MGIGVHNGLPQTACDGRDGVGRGVGLVFTPQVWRTDPAHHADDDQEQPLAKSWIGSYDRGQLPSVMLSSFKARYSFE